METTPSFEGSHQKYVEAWNHGWATGEAYRIAAFISPSYFGTFCAPGMEQPETLDYAAVVQGIGQALLDIPAGRQRCEGLQVNWHGDNEVIVTYRKVVANPHTNAEATAMQLEVWRLENDHWRLLREYVEV